MYENQSQDGLLYDEQSMKVYDLCMYAPHTVCAQKQWREQLTLVLVKTGSLFLTINGEAYQAGAREVVLIPPRVQYSAKTGTTATSYYTIVCDLQMFLNEILENRRLLAPILAGEMIFPAIIRDEETIAPIQSIITLCLHQKAYTALLFSAYIYTFFGTLYQKNRPQNIRARVVENPFAEVITYINENYAKPISVADISREFGYAESYFCRTFKSITGMTPVNYIRALRMEQARHLLLEGELSIADIAIKCGFSDSGYFTRCFKRVYGMAPTQYLTERQLDK